jgi:hypothetical protein
MSGGSGGSSGSSKNHKSKSEKKQQTTIDDIVNNKKRTSRQKHQEEQGSLQKLVSNVSQATLEGIVLGAVCAVVPGAAAVVIPLYKLYQVGKAAVEVHKAYENTKGDQEDKTNAAIKEGAKQGVKLVAGEVVGQMTESSAGQVADSVVSTAEHSGTIDAVAQSTHVESGVYSQMLRGSIKTGLTEGLGELAGLAITGGD